MIDDELDDYLHLYTLNRGIVMTPFHNMALMCPATTAGRRRPSQRGLRRGARRARLAERDYPRGGAAPRDSRADGAGMRNALGCALAARPRARRRGRRRARAGRAAARHPGRCAADLAGAERVAVRAGPRPQGHPLQHRLGAGRARRGPSAPDDPADPAYDFKHADAMARQTAAIGAQSLFTIVNAPRWANGEQGAALRAGSTPTTTASSAVSSPGATRARTRRRARSCRCPQSRTSPSGTSPTAASTCCRRAVNGQTAARTFARARARVRRRRARRLARRARGRRADREPRRPGRRVADRVPRRLPEGRRPAPAGARVQPVHERPRAGLQAQGDAGRRRHHAAQPRPARALAEASPTAAASRSGSPSSPGAPRPTPKLGTISPAKQADLLRKTVDLVRTHYPYAKLLVWYLVRDESPTSYWRSGLATFDWQQKPAYGLYKVLAGICSGRRAVETACSSPLLRWNRCSASRWPSSTSRSERSPRTGSASPMPVPMPRGRAPSSCSRPSSRSRATRPRICCCGPRSCAPARPRPSCSRARSSCRSWWAARGSTATACATRRSCSRNGDDPGALRQARAAQLRRLRRGAHVLARPRLAARRDARRRARADDLRGRLAARRRGRGGGARRGLRAQHLGLALPPRQGPGARGDARDARTRRALRRRLLQSRGRPGRARLRRAQRGLRARRRRARARRLLRRGAPRLRPRARRLGARAPARLAPAPRAPPSRAPARDDRAAARRASAPTLASSVALAAGGRAGRAVGRAAPRARSTTCARTASSASCSGLSGGIDSALVAALAADALGADRVEAVSMPTRYNSEGTRSDARLVAERLGIAFRELAIEDLRLAFEGALPGHERPGGREPAGAHPRRAADDALATSTAGSC